MKNARQELVEYFLRRTDETLVDAKSLAQSGSWHSCLNRLYYACFYAVQAALNQKLLIETKTHAGIKTLFNLHFVKEGLVSKELSTFYATLLQRRGTSDYDAFEEVNAEDILPLLDKAGIFITTIKRLVHSNS